MYGDRYPLLTPVLSSTHQHLHGAPTPPAHPTHMPHPNSHGTPIAEGSCTLLSKENPSSSEHCGLCLLQGGLQRMEQGNRTHLQRRTRKRRDLCLRTSLVQHVTESSLLILQQRAFTFPDLALFPKRSMRTEQGRLREYCFCFPP